MQYRPWYAMRMTRTAVGAAFLALFFMAIPAHAGVYKWVDENGRAHYSEQPPNKGEHTQLHIQAAPSKPQHESGNTIIPPNPMQDAQQRLIESDKQDRARYAAEQEKAKAEQKRHDDQIAEDKKSGDDALIDECKRNREVYCDKGVEKIKSEEDMRRFDAEIEKSRARNPVVPRYTGNDIHIR